MADPEPLTLSTPRLLLRPLHDGDAPALLAIFSDPQVMRYWSTPAWTDIAQAHALIARDVQGRASGEHLRLGIERRADGRLLGHCALFNIQKQNRRADLGYGLGSAAWGQGFAQEAVGALLDHGFGPALQLHRVEADIDPRNAASAKVLERLGFTREGYLRERWHVGNEISDTALYGLLAREWAARRA
jgi:RimJ/RimL family protein N-acetyltransferase